MQSPLEYAQKDIMRIGRPVAQEVEREAGNRKVAGSISGSSWPSVEAYLIHLISLAFISVLRGGS